MRKRARIIYNPTSGREALRSDLVDILAVYEQAGYETSAYATTPEPDSAKNEATRAAKEGFDLIVAAGGDGTLNEVINGIAGLEKRPTLAVIPAGTTNDYARALRVPREDPIAAAKLILNPDNRFKIDIGKANENYFMNIAAGGTLTELTYEVPSQMKSLFGYAAYFAKGAELLPQVKPVEMSIKYDGHEFRGKASTIFLALTNSVGGFEQIVPDASLDDGNFSLIIVKDSSLFGMMQLMAKALKGTHVDDPRVIYVKAKDVVVTPLDKDDRLMINLDGEYGGDAPMHFVNLHQHLQVVANMDEIPDNALTAAMQKMEDDFVREIGGMKDPDQK
ncbi:MULTISPECIES: diacylglycerol kinase [Lactobacillaceae]|uniref:Diacylglycerol kinase n=1 Tax=Limosilactobacillus alvi TaxID=990412 RepID=A0ABS2EP22_9LACO|nr:MULTISPECIES: diacylglycerol kinase [Lactobacillaceae]MBM6754232.1 diacylglycerol kinase [Limosilactobacillus alvi]QLL70462.1 diacylglycerol kinase [Lactobacillus sp. 3B(2020)]